MLNGLNKSDYIYPNQEIIVPLQGVNIYVIPLFDFIMLDEDEQCTDEHMWMINDDNRLIYKGMIVGQVSKNRNSVSDYATPTSYTMFYGKYLRAKKEKEHKAETETSVKVVTERVTVEKLRAEGEARFKAVVRESEEKYRNTGLEIEKKLKLLEIERDSLVRKVKR